MKILNLRHTGAGTTFDVQLLPTVRLLNWSAKRSGDGRLRLFPPTPRHGSPSAIVAPETMSEIAQLVERALGGDRPDVRSQ